MWEYNQTPSSDELYHFGIKGMHWGVRRYRNEDGSLTEAGKQRYSNMHPNRVRRKLVKEIRKERKRQYGSGEQWDNRNGIGQNSKRVIKDARKVDLDWAKTNDAKAHKKAIRELDSKYNKELQKINKAYEESRSDVFRSADKFDGYDKLDSQYRKQVSEINRRYNKPDKIGYYTIYGKGSTAYNDRSQKYYDSLTDAYLEDLGYDKASRALLKKRINKSDRRWLT